MGLFDDIKNWLVNTWNVSQHFDPYFKNFQSELSTLKIINEEVNPEITRIYNQIKTTAAQKYAKQIKQYEIAVDSAKEHNEKVRTIVSGMKGFEYDKILDNPYSFNYSLISNYDKTANLIRSFPRRADIYDDFLEHVEIVKDHYSEMLEEYDLVALYNKAREIDESLGYIDALYKNNLISHREAIKQKINSHSMTFYKLESNNVITNAIKSHNQRFIEENKKDVLFDNVNGCTLDSEQRESILTDELSTLVIGSAGSGKTLTICGKVKYLLEKKNVKPSDVLLLSYSRNSAEDLQRKISKIDPDLTVGTFHKIGLNILKMAENKVLTAEDQYSSIIEQYFSGEMKNRPHMLQTILTYYGLYLASDKHDKKYKSEGEMYEDLRKSDFSTLRSQLLRLTNNINKRKTINQELVKSFEEMAIANWYFINGIDYIYEGPYEKDVSTIDKRQYLPDFRLPKYKIYHEHYGINKNGKAEQFDDEEGAMYVANMQWKRALHQENNTVCIETYSYEFDDGTIFEKLEKELKKRGVVFKPLNDKQIFNAINSIYEGKAFRSFINLIKTFLSLYKSTYRTDDGFEKLKNYNFANRYERKRADLFLDIVKDVYNYYISYLRGEEKIDFDDMILQAIDKLDSTDSFKYKYIIVDEFQDISFSRMKFLKKLIEHGKSKLFAVGDDWQAIYRFSGCDLNIFLRFSDYFGDSAITKITTTHRNCQALQDIAGPFIKKNPEQIDKSIRSANVRQIENPVQIMYYSEKKYYAFLDVLKAINRINPEAEVLILGRNNKDFEDISLDNRIYIDFRASDKKTSVVRVSNFPKMKLTFNTVHGSKGLEAEFVIILNADDNRLGFPNKMEDDELLDMVLSSKSAYEYAEERRLWYVALTRTKSYTFIIAHIENPSIFVKEIENKCFIMNPNIEVSHDGEISCPYCKTGRLVIRESEGHNFYGCSNYPYCTYTIDDFRAVKNNYRCEKCGDFMIFHAKGKYGPFYGCHNYKRCGDKTHSASEYEKNYQPPKPKNVVADPSQSNDLDDDDLFF